MKYVGYLGGNEGVGRYGKIWVLVKMRSGCGGCIAIGFLKNLVVRSGEKYPRIYPYKVAYKVLHVVLFPS